MQITLQRSSIICTRCLPKLITHITRVFCSSQWKMCLLMYYAYTCYHRAEETLFISCQPIIPRSCEVSGSASNNTFLRMCPRLWQKTIMPPNCVKCLRKKNVVVRADVGSVEEERRWLPRGVQSGMRGRDVIENNHVRIWWWRRCLSWWMEFCMYFAGLVYIPARHSNLDTTVCGF